MFGILRQQNPSLTGRASRTLLKPPQVRTCCLLTPGNIAILCFRNLCTALEKSPECQQFHEKSLW